MSSANEPIDETPAGHGRSAFLPLKDVLTELRAVASAHLEEGALVLEATGIRLAFALAVVMLAVLAVTLAWAIGCGAALYYLSLAMSPLWAIAVGIGVHLAIAVALFRFACREIERIKAYFSAGVRVREPEPDHTAVN